MKPLMIILAIILASGCTSRDIVTMDTTTKQNFDLNDNDKDGVIMARERCEGTITGADIDNYGCGTLTTIDERQNLEILFANNSHYIEPLYYDQIQKVADIMQRYPSSKVTIEGHCSQSGSYELNLALSQRRAKAVTEVLIDTYGIEPDRLTAIGYSFDQPIADNHTEEGRRLNRRVIAAVKGDGSETEMKWHIYTVDEETE
ncbi:OmpA family protein [Shewanella sp. WXL01]|uniref:OmpA family protein n=1 Tax=Shewanella maritima TaxID=2520507 RepID=A0A411PIX5_9GAMM|nr:MULTISPECIES: OmpA family protein [Shewanella]NKF52241.1 OmpA family protein [Shewanella sp. WXL01]QBF83495.1 OmpA family protein [Shewanella maritima]